MNSVVRQSDKTNWTSLNRKCLGKKEQMIPAKGQKYSSLTPQKAPEDTDIIITLQVRFRPFQKNISGKKTLFTQHAKTEK